MCYIYEHYYCICSSILCYYYALLHLYCYAVSLLSLYISLRDYAVLSCAVSVLDCHAVPCAPIERRIEGNGWRRGSVVA